MPIQEYLVSSTGQLPAPAGLSAPAWSKTQDAEIAAWKEAVPHLVLEMRQGRYIMVLVFVRTGVAKWNEQANNFDFNPKNDAIIAAYSVSANLSPYPPGTCSAMFYKAMVAAMQTGKSAHELRAKVLTDAAYLEFQMPEGTRPIEFQEVGVVQLIKGLENTGKPFIEAATRAARDGINSEKYGWRGGAFPPLKTSLIGRHRG